MLLFGFYALLDGLFALAAAFSGRGRAGPWWALLIEGVIGVAAGVIAFAWPGITELALLIVIAVWSIATGVFEVVAAIRLRKEIDNEWAMAAMGVLSILFGVFLLALPGAGLLTIAIIVGVNALLFGVLMLLLAFRLRNRGRTPGAPPV